MTSSTHSCSDPVVGAIVEDGGVMFRLWAPKCSQVALVLFDSAGMPAHETSMEAAADGYFISRSSLARAGTRYGFRPKGSSLVYPDPASRFQPQGVHKPSEVVDSRSYRWNNANWPGVALRGQVIYELHIGTFTPEGTWSAAVEKLAHLADIGITLLEVMPVNEFFGNFGWGYDGVHWFAPTRLYGSPDDFRAFVDRAHALGLGVMLDVVYNHFGPCGNYTGVFSSEYVTPTHTTEWGEALNYDGKNCAAIREFAVVNAAYWIREFHLDGLRLDATQAIFDDSPRHILADVSVAARAAAGDRQILLFAENERQDVRHLAPPAEGGFGLDGLWNDDFHHTCRVAATGQGDGYYQDYQGSPQEMISAACRGYLYQGQWHSRQAQRRGTSNRTYPAASLVNFMENHDQVANSTLGCRPHQLTSSGRWRALTTLLLLSPGTPLLFMGQEFAASTPFLYFADQEPGLAHLVRDGRWQFLRQFSRSAGAHVRALLPEPAAESTFQMCKLKWEEVSTHAPAIRLHRDLLHLRRKDETFAAQLAAHLQGAVIASEAFVLRWFDGAGGDRLLLINLGRDLNWLPITEPLAAPPNGKTWEVLWSSDDQEYGGLGISPFCEDRWFIPGHAATVLSACPVIASEA